MLRIKRLYLISLFFIIIFNIQSLYASMLSGTFEVTSTSCPAYVSKNKQTNPGDIHVTQGQIYEIKEGNTDINPTWYRIYIANAPENTLRWVSSNCGVASIDSNPSQCILQPGRADSYVLAINWQSGFCETSGFDQGKPECVMFSSTGYSAHHFSLHGLWPNQADCGLNYNFCNTHKQSSFCQYAPLDLNEDTSNHLKILMPSYAYGSCLERHEWNKHGSCQLLDQSSYFDEAMTFVDEINLSSFNTFIDQHRGDNITIDEFNEAFDHAFGDSMSSKVYIGCKNNKLVDVYINLPALENISTSKLSELLPLAKDANSDHCPYEFMISDFHNI